MEYRCKICGIEFNRLHELGRHTMDVHYRKRLVECKYCGSVFSNSSSYRVHKFRYHKEHLKFRRNKVITEQMPNYIEIVKHCKYCHQIIR